MIIIDKIFLSFWTSYFDAVWALVTNNMSAWPVYIDHVFPKMAKCDFIQVGPSGQSEMRDAFCLLSLNILNEKIFAFLYIWLIITFILSIVSVLNTIATLISKQYRLFRLRRVTMYSFSQDEMHRITNRGSIGDVFVMYQMTRNVPMHLFIDLLYELLAIRNNRSVSFSKERDH